MAKYIAPSFKATHFNCPSCGAFAGQEWFQLAKKVYWNDNEEDVDHTEVKLLFIVECAACENPSLWYGGSQFYPQQSSAPIAHEDMPADVKADYDEARRVVAASPRAAAALLRLALQRLLVHLGQPGKDINSEIGNLVKAGLPVQIQQALDIVRVVGNESVHPGELNVNDSPDIAAAMFDCLNLIVDNRICQPKLLNELTARLPASKRKGIEDRDRKP